MEEVGKKNNLLVVLLLLLLIASCGFIVYDKFLKEDSGTCVNTPSQNDKTSFYQNMIKNRKTMNAYGHGVEIVIDKDGNAYYSAKKVKNAVGTKGDYTIEGYEAGIDPKTNSITNKLSGYKLPVKNVIATYYSEYGNGGGRSYIFIKGDGTIARLNYFIEDIDNSEIEIIEFEETVAGYKDIVGILPNNSNTAADYNLYDINGNIFD